MDIFTVEYKPRVEFGKLSGNHQKFVDKNVHDIKNRLKEVYGETLPRELDREVDYIVTETYKAVLRTLVENGIS